MTFSEKHAERVLCKFTGDGILNYVPFFLHCHKCVLCKFTGEGILNYVPFFLQCHKWVAIVRLSQPITVILQDWIVAAVVVVVAVCLLPLFLLFCCCCCWL